MPLITAGSLFIVAAIAGLLGKSLAIKPPEPSVNTESDVSDNDANNKDEDNDEDRSAQDDNDTPPKATIVRRNLTLTYIVMAYTLLPVIFGAAMIGLACFRSFALMLCYHPIFDLCAFVVIRPPTFRS